MPREFQQSLAASWAVAPPQGVLICRGHGLAPSSCRVAAPHAPPGFPNRAAVLLSDPATRHCL